MGQEKIEELLDHLNEAKILADELIEEISKSDPIYCHLHGILLHTKTSTNSAILRLTAWHNNYVK